MTGKPKPENNKPRIVRPDVAETRFHVCMRLINQHLPKTHHLKDHHAQIIWALARKVQVSYPNGIDGLKNTVVYTSRPDLKRTGLLSCCEKTIYNRLCRLEATGIIGFRQMNSADGSRCIRNPKSAFAVWISPWVLLGDAIPDAFLAALQKKSETPPRPYLSPSGENLPLLSTYLNLNNINTDVNMLAAQLSADRTPSPPPPHTEPPNPEHRNREPLNPEPGTGNLKKADRGQKNAPTAAHKPATPSHVQATPEQPEPSPIPEKGRPSPQNQNPGGGGRGAGQRTKERLYGLPKPLAEKPQPPDKQQVWLLMLEFWSVVKVRIYNNAHFNPERELQIQTMIFESVYNNGHSAAGWKMEKWHTFQTQLYERADMVAAWLKRGPDRFVMQPWQYFDPNNTKSGFANTYQWWCNQRVLYAEVRAGQEVSKAIRSIREGRPPKGNPPMSGLQLSQYWRVKIAAHRCPAALDSFNAFLTTHRF